MLENNITKFRIKIPDNYSFEELKKEIENGGKFIMFPYTISIVAVTLPHFSQAIFVKKNESVRKYQRQYNLLSSCFGWWGLPWGPIETVKSIRNTSKGGIDVTEDIMLNLNEINFLTREIEWKQSCQMFCKLDKWDKKEFIKALVPIYERDYNIQKIVIGYYIEKTCDTDVYYIGLKCTSNFEKYIDVFKLAIYTRFKENTGLCFLDLSVEEKDLSDFLENQGDVIFER